MKTIPTQPKTKRLIEETLKAIAKDSEHLGATHGISGIEGFSGLNDCVDPILRATNRLIITAYQSLMSFSATDPDKAREESEKIKDTIDDLKQQNRLDVHHLQSQNLPWGTVARLLVWVLLSFLIFISDWAIMASVLELYMPTLLLSISLAVGIGVALYLLPVLSLIQASKVTSERKRKWIIWRSFLLSLGIFLLLLVARRQFESETGHEQTVFATVLFLALNCLFFVICHYLAKFFLLPTVYRLKEVWEYFRCKRRIRKREAEIAELEREVVKYKQDEELHEEARNQALLNEEEIARGYLENISIYRRAFRSKANGTAPSFLSNTAPEPDFILRGKTTTSSQSPFRGVRTRIGYILIFLAICSGYSCSFTEREPTHFVGFLHDLTIADTTRITADRLLSTTGLSNEPNIGVEICISSISAKTYPSVHRLSLASTSQLFSNSTKRPGIIRGFSFQVDSILEQMREPAREDITGESLVFLQLSRMLGEYEGCQVCSEGTLVIQSDLGEHSAIFSCYQGRFQTDKVATVLKNAYPPPLITKPLRVIVVHDPLLSDQELFGHMVEVLNGYLSELPNITIEVVPALA